MYSGYGIQFDDAGFWSYGNDFAGNVVIFAGDNSLSSHVDNHKNYFFSVWKRTGRVGTAEKKFSINFNKIKAKFSLSLYCNHDNSYLFLNRKKSINLKPITILLIFQTNFV